MTTSVETAFARVLDALQAHGCTIRGGGSRRNARCPAHDDTNPSLSVTAEDSRVLVHCHAGCDTADVLAALNLTKADLFDEPRQRNGAAPMVVAEYAYVDEQGRLLYVVERRTPKAFRQRRPDGSGGWEWRLGDTRRVLYRLPAVLAAVAAGQTVHVVEGEKDVHAVEAAGQVATCNPGGAGKWRDEYSEHLRGADVVIVADRDDTGRSHARAVHAQLAGKASTLRLVEPVVGKDIADHLAAGRALADVVEVDPSREPIDPHTWLLGEVVACSEEGEPGEEADTDRAAILGRYTPIHWPDLWADTTDEGPDWLVPDVLERGRSHALVGAAKSGKSLLALDLVCGLVTGRPLLGRPSPHDRAVRVLYVDLENAKADIRERLDAFGVGPGDLNALAYYSFPSLPALDSPRGGEHLLALAEHHDSELVVIDTVARVVVGPENDADTFRALYRHALAPLKAQARAALRLDHLGKDSTAGARGSSAKADDVDTIWHLVDHGEGQIALRLDRQRSGHHPETVDLIRRTIDPPGQLHHVRVEALGDPRVGGLVADLERLGVPVGAGRRAARKALADAGIKAGNDLIDRALETRQNHDQVCPAQINSDELYEIIGAVPDGSGPETKKPSSKRARHTPGTSGTGAAVPEAECAAPIPCPVRGTGEGTPPAPGPDTDLQNGSAPAGALTCSRCQYPAERLIQGHCPRCAYPAGGAPDDDTEE